LALSPRKLARDNREESEVDAAERRVDHALSAMQDKTSTEITVDIGVVHRGVREELIQRYKDAGWRDALPHLSNRHIILIK
jgi:hypothetical protein